MAVTIRVAGWKLLTDAASEFKVHPETLRRLVKADVFTRGQFTPGLKAPVYLKVKELEAYSRGGIPAVEASREASRKKRKVDRKRIV